MTKPVRSRRFGGFTAWALAATTFVSVAAAGAAPVSAATPTDLFISEYVEGSSNSKAIEIYNGTGGDIDLAGYALDVYFNGNTTAGTSIALTGVVASGDVFVVADDGAAAPVLAVTDQQTTASLFNGDDAITLTRDGVVIDSFGQIGTDPGSEWTGGGQDDTLRRLPDVCAGDTEPTDGFDAGLEYEVFAQDTFDGLGSHTTNCDVVVDDPTVVINEVDADTPGTDEAEFIELYDGGIGGTDLSGLALVLFNGSNDLSYNSIDLDGYTTDDGGYFVVCGDAADVANCDLDASPDTDFVQNGADAVALYAADAASFPNGTPVGTDALVDALVYDTNDGDDPELLVLTPGQPQIDEAGGGDKDNQSNQRCSDGAGGPLVTTGYTQFSSTPGTENCVLVSVDPVVLINEFDPDTPGTDTAEFIELYDGGVGGTDLSGLTLVLVNGSDDQSYDAFDLDGLSTDEDGYAVLCGAAGDIAAVCDADAFSSLQNGADAIALYEGDAASFPNDTPITLDGLVDAVVYGTSDADDAALLALLNEGQAQLDDTDTESLQRCPNGAGDLRSTDTYAQFAPTPGAENCVTPPPPPLDCTSDVTITPISAVQGSGDASPIAGTTVVIEGTVVADFQTDPDGNSPLRGFNVQDAGDGDPATSDGVFVFNDGVEVAVGDIVRVQGVVTEFNGLTEISPATAVAVCASGIELPAATQLTLPVADLAEFEAVEGMLVTFPQDLVISEYFNFDRFGEIVLTDVRQNTPTAVVEPGQPAIDLAEDQALARITLDDGLTNQNPDPARHPDGAPFTLDNRFRGGDTVTDVTGVMHYGFDLYRIQPTQGAEYTPVNLRTAAPEDVGGDVTVASFNVLNYFTTLDEGSDVCGPAENQECRGADDAEELERQRAKIVSAITAIDADVVGLIEIENDVEDAAVADLVANLNLATGQGTYAAIDTGAIGTDAIKVALIYQPAAVTPVGDFAILDESVDPRFIDDKNRPALAQTFSENATGSVFTVTVNHLKSKGSDCDDLGDPDLGDGAGNCNVTRTQAAEALVDWLATDPTGSGDADSLIIGDLNSYDEEDPIDAIITGADDVAGTDDDYTDLVQQYQGDEAYSYVFDGKIGYLDHALASTTLSAQVTGTTVWHINADEPDLLDYDTSFKKDAQDAIYAPDPYRSSDHDPVVIGLDLTEPVGELTIDHALIVAPRRGPGTAVIAGSVDDTFTSCPTFELSIADQVVAEGSPVRRGRNCISLTRAGLVKFDLRTSSFTAVLALPRGFDVGGDTVSFELTLDDAAYATDVTGRSLGPIWIA